MDKKVIEFTPIAKWTHYIVVTLSRSPVLEKVLLFLISTNVSKLRGTQSTEYQGGKVCGTANGSGKGNQ